MHGLIVYFLVFSLIIFNAVAQQMYPGNLVMYCNDTGEGVQSAAVLYSCNDHQDSCPAFLIFRSQHNYDTVSTISDLTSSEPLEIARINNISTSEILAHGTEVIIPVHCSCSGQYYQANTTYTIQSDDDAYLTIANSTYQGLTTCNALMRENSYDKGNLSVGLRLQVPLRCACPAKDQIQNGTKFLLTYLISQGEIVFSIIKRFNVSGESFYATNKFPDDNPDLIYPFTTVLIPLGEEPKAPLTSETKPFNLPPQQGDKTSHKGLYIGLGAGMFVAILCFILCLAIGRRAAEGLWFCKSRAVRRTWKLPTTIVDGIAKINEELKVYTVEELEAATNNFSPLKRLGGSVYKGVLRGKLLAIKRTSGYVEQEVKILSKIYHFNVISLYGFCESNAEFYLVYEFMEMGSLKEWLQKENHDGVQSWNERIVIALDVANGLDYLHNFTNPGYVHKQISSDNVLLNKDLRAKLACFGHARSADNSLDDSIPSLSFALGEKGYLAPEYLENGKVTSALDVYAFGVVLLELVTGKEAVQELTGKQVLLSDSILSIMERSNSNVELQKVIDPRLQVKHPLGYVIDQTELAMRLIKLSVACLARDPARRPSMAEVVSALLKIQLDVQRLEPMCIE